jgi:hypothetical protein
MSDNFKRIVFIISIIVIGIGLGVLADSFFPGGDYMTPLFIVLAIHIYLEDMFEKEHKRKNKPRT